MKKYFVEVMCDGPGIFPKSEDGVRGTAFIRARSRDAAAKRMLDVFFNRFPQALENRLSVTCSVKGQSAGHHPALAR